jgi:hypothetical protein
MTEVDICNTLGMLQDPACNRLPLTPELINDIRQVAGALREAWQQKNRYGALYEDLWLEFIPWHSLN